MHVVKRIALMMFAAAALALIAAVTLSPAVADRNETGLVTLPG